MSSEGIPVTRAQHYVHEDQVCRSEVDTDGPKLREDGGIIDLALDHLTIDDRVRLDKVTISASGPDRNDAYGYEFDLEPDAARRLANELIVAAHAADVSTPADEGRG